MAPASPWEDWMGLLWPRTGGQVGSSQASYLFLPLNHQRKRQKRSTPKLDPPFRLPGRKRGMEKPKSLFHQLRRRPDGPTVKGPKRNRNPISRPPRGSAYAPVSVYHFVVQRQMMKCGLEGTLRGDGGHALPCGSRRVRTPTALYFFCVGAGRPRPMNKRAGRA